MINKKPIVPLPLEDRHNFAQWFCYNYGSFPERVVFPLVDIWEYVADRVTDESLTQYHFILQLSLKFNIYKHWSRKKVSDHLLSPAYRNDQERGLRVIDQLIFSFGMALSAGKLFDLTTIEDLHAQGIETIDEKGKQIK